MSDREAHSERRDQQFHDLVGAAIDALDAGVPVHAGDRIFVHVAIAAEQLKAFVDDFSLEVGQPVLRHRRGYGVEAAVDVAGDAIIIEDAADGGFRLQFGELELRVLKIDDRLAESLSLLDVVDGQGKRALIHGDRGGAYLQAFLRQLLHELDEALTFLVAEQVGGRHADIIKEAFRRVVRLQPDLVEVAATLEAIDLVGLNDNQRGALGPLVGICLGHDDDEIGKLAIGDEGLRAVDQIVVAVLLGAKS